MIGCWCVHMCVTTLGLLGNPLVSCAVPRDIQRVRPPPRHEAWPVADHARRDCEARPTPSPAGAQAFLCPPGQKIHSMDARGHESAESRLPRVAVEVKGKAWRPRELRGGPIDRCFHVTRARNQALCHLSQSLPDLVVTLLMISAYTVTSTHTHIATSNNE